MRGFENLECYQLAMNVFLEGYKVASLLPVEEKNKLADQLRRTSTNIVLNIPEEYGPYHYLDSLRLDYIVRGSIMEVLSAFITCDDRDYTRSEISQQRELCHSALRSRNGYIRYVCTRQQGQKEYGDQALKEDAATYAISDLPAE